MFLGIKNLPSIKLIIRYCYVKYLLKKSKIKYFIRVNFYKMNNIFYRNIIYSNAISSKQKQYIIQVHFYKYNLQNDQKFNTAMF